MKALAKGCACHLETAPYCKSLAQSLEEALPSHFQGPRDLCHVCKMWQTLCMISVLDISAWQNASMIFALAGLQQEQRPDFRHACARHSVASAQLASHEAIYEAVDMQTPASVDDSTSPLSSNVGVSFRLEKCTRHPSV